MKFIIYTAYFLLCPCALLRVTATAGSTVFKLLIAGSFVVPLIFSPVLLADSFALLPAERIRLIPDLEQVNNWRCWIEV